MANKSYDVVVIGAGLAGLSAAAHLAKAGKKVAVFEQSDKPGGYYTSFSRKGVIFDITAHWTVDHEKVNRMLEGLGVPPIDFVHHTNIGQYIGPGSNGGILLVDNRERMVRSIMESYPGVKRESVDKLIELSLKAEEELRSIELHSPELMSLPAKALMMVQVPLKLRTVMKYGRMPLAQFLESLFPGDEMEGLRCALYMITPIKNITAIGLLVYIGFALRGRAYWPEGGAIKAGERFAAAAIRNGAEIRYGAKVKAIRVQDRRVRGIALENGDEIDAKYVVSAADARQTFFRLMDPSQAPEDIKQKLENTHVSDTFVIVSIVTDIDPAANGPGNTDAFISATTDINKALTPDDPGDSMFSIQFPEFHEKHADGRLHGIQLVALASFEFRDHWRTGPGYERTEEYGQLKEEFARKLIWRAEQYIPGLSEHIISMDVATPMTMHRYTLNNHGSPVGWSYADMKRWNQKVPFIHGLYLAGHWVGPSGIYNVTASGKNAAELILRNKN